MPAKDLMKKENTATYLLKDDDVLKVNVTDISTHLSEEAKSVYKMVMTAIYYIFKMYNVTFTRQVEAHTISKG